MNSHFKITNFDAVSSALTRFVTFQNVSGFTMLLVLLFISALCQRFFCVPDAYLDGGVKTGDATFYNEWSYNHGSCGTIPKSGFYVAALSSKYMALPSGLTNPNNHPLCGPKYCILASGPNGAMVVKVSDTCGGCPVGLDDVDFADTVFKNIANPKDGRVKITWKFVDCNKYKPGIISRDEADEVLSGKVTPATNEKENEVVTKTAKKDTPTTNGVKKRKPKSGTPKSAPTNGKKSEVKKQTKSNRTRNAPVRMAKASSPIVVVHSEDNNGDEPPVQTSDKIKRTPAVAEKPRDEVVMTEIIESEPINLPENADDSEAQVVNERSAAKSAKPTGQTPLLADAQPPPRNFASIDLASLDPTRNEHLKAVVSDPDVGNLYKSLQFSILYYLEEIGKVLAGKSHKKIKFVNKIPSSSNTKSEE